MFGKLMLSLKKRVIIYTNKGIAQRCTSPQSSIHNPQSLTGFKNAKRSSAHLNKHSTNKINHLKICQWVPSLYFLQGLSFTLIAFTSVVMYKKLGVSNLNNIFYTSLLYLPWGLRPLWAPIIEAISTKKRWTIVTQGLMALISGLIAFSLLSHYFFILTLMLFFLMALTGAIHDTASDGAYLLNLTLPAQEFYIGIRTVFFNSARFVSEGGLLIFVGLLSYHFAEKTSWQIGFLSVMGLYVILASYHAVFFPEKETHRAQSVKIRTAYREIFQIFLRLPNVFFIVGFFLIYNAAEAQLIKVAPLFLLDHAAQGGLGLSTHAVGWVFGVADIVALMVGLLVSSAFISKFSLKKCLVPMTFLVVLANTGYLILSYTHHHSFGLIIAIVAFAEFGFGVSTSAYLTVMLRVLANEKYQTALYSFGTTLNVIGMMSFSAMGGFIEYLLGYHRFFIWIVLLGIGIAVYTMFLNKRCE